MTRPKPSGYWNDKQIDKVRPITPSAGQKVKLPRGNDYPRPQSIYSNEISDGNTGGWSCPDCYKWIEGKNDKEARRNMSKHCITAHGMDDERLEGYGLPTRAELREERELKRFGVNPNTKSNIQNVSDYRGQQLKKDLGINRAIKRYENKHVDGSGNFGFTLVTKKDEWFDLHGDYRPNGELIRLYINTYSGTGGGAREVAEGLDYKGATESIKSYISQHENIGQTMSI